MTTENIKWWECEFIDSSQFDGNGECEEYYKHKPTGRTFTLTLSLDTARENPVSWEEYKEEGGE